MKSSSSRRKAKSIDEVQMMRRLAAMALYRCVRQIGSLRVRSASDAAALVEAGCRLMNLAESMAGRRNRARICEKTPAR